MIFVFASVGPTNAQVAELADALDSGSSAGNGVEVRILSWAPPISKVLGPTSVRSAHAPISSPSKIGSYHTRFHACVPRHS
jgi:hypothetical protein